MKVNQLVFIKLGCGVFYLCLYFKSFAHQNNPQFQRFCTRKRHRLQKCRNFRQRSI